MRSTLRTSKPSFERPLRPGTVSGDAAFERAVIAVANAQAKGLWVVAVGLWDGIAILDREKDRTKEIH